MRALDGYYSGERGGPLIYIGSRVRWTSWQRVAGVQVLRALSIWATSLTVPQGLPQRTRGLSREAFRSGYRLAHSDFR